MSYLSLNDEELVLLDGKCRDDIQIEVNKAKARLNAINENIGDSAAESAFIADVIAEATNNGKLVKRRCHLSSCRLCAKRGGYVRYKSGRNKGANNYSKPTYLNGVELAERFVTCVGSCTLGCCSDCFAKVRPKLAEALLPIKAEIGESITGLRQLYKKSPKVRCKKCEWFGHKEQLGNLRTLIGYGLYRGKCPECGAENGLMTHSIEESQTEFEIIPNDID